MAIKVVQGLVETGLSTRGAATASPVSTTNQSQLNTGFGQQVQVLQVASAAAQKNSATAQLSQGDAVISLVRTHKISTDGKKVKDSDTAKDLADSIAERVRSPEGDGLAAHGGLKSSEARQCFSS